MTRPPLHSRVTELDALIAAGDDGDVYYANRVLRELVELQFAILTKQVPLSNDDLRARVIAARDQGIPVVQFSWLVTS